MRSNRVVTVITHSRALLQWTPSKQFKDTQLEFNWRSHKIKRLADIIFSQFRAAAMPRAFAEMCRISRSSRPSSHLSATFERCKGRVT